MDKVMKSWKMFILSNIITTIFCIIVNDYFSELRSSKVQGHQWQKYTDARIYKKADFVTRVELNLFASVESSID
jgi:uncharacterized protein YpmB